MATKSTSALSVPSHTEYPYSDLLPNIDLKITPTNIKPTRDAVKATPSNDNKAKADKAKADKAKADADSKKRKHIMIGVFVVVIIIIIAGLLIYFLFYKKNEDAPPKSNPSDPSSNVSAINGNYGAVTSQEFIPAVAPGHFPASKLSRTQCTERNNAFWRGDRCECLPAWYGNICNLQKFPTEFNDVGTIPLDAICGNSVCSNAQFKAFTEGSCSEQCNELDDCSGFWYENKRCVLFKGPIQIDNSQLKYKLEEESNLFMRINTDNLHDTNINTTNIFLGNELVRRPWFLSKMIKPGVLYKLDFLPSVFTGPNNVRGIFTNEPFSEILFDAIEHTNHTMYVHHGNERLNIPLDLRLREVYVMYKHLC